MFQRLFSSSSKINIPKSVQALGKKKVTALSLEQMKSFSNLDPKTRIISASFLYQELQIRYARAYMHLSELPFGIGQTATVVQAARKYARYLEELQALGAPKNLEDDKAFTALIRGFKTDASDIVPLVCDGVRWIKTSMDAGLLEQESTQTTLNTALDTFFLGRIGIRMLKGQHIQGATVAGGRVTIVQPSELAESAVQKATELCRKIYGQAPKVDIVVASTSDRFIYVQSHLYIMIFELVKNAMRATVEYETPKPPIDNAPIQVIDPVMNTQSSQLGFIIPDEIDPSVSVYSAQHANSITNQSAPIKIIISQGSEDLTIKISDVAGGIPRSHMNKIWQYTYTTDDSIRDRGDLMFREQFSGGGYGLPIARLFARYLGGEVTLLSMEGYGTDAYIQVHKLGQHTEVIPGQATTSVTSLWY